MHKALPSIIGYKYASNWVWQGYDTYTHTFIWLNLTTHCVALWLYIIIWFVFQLLTICTQIKSILRIQWKVQQIFFKEFYLDWIWKKNRFSWTGTHVIWRIYLYPMYKLCGCGCAFAFILLLQIDSMFDIRHQIQFMCVLNWDNVLTWLIHRKIHASNTY